MEYLVMNANQALEQLYDTIVMFGVDTNIGTKAVYNIGISIINPADRDITVPWRKWSKKYAEREWNWYLSKNRSVEEIKKFAPTWDKMHGRDNIVNSNYGWQLSRNDQLEKCIEQLRSNKNTRQAWCTIFDGKEKDDYAYDTPCTLNVGFSFRPEYSGQLLDMTVIMRSNDLIFGFCNDQYCFSKIQEYVAAQLGVRMGSYYHFVHDMHIYEKHFNMKKDYFNT